MIKINFCFFSLMLFFLSCEKDNNIVNISPRPSGKYISEIKLYGFPWLEKMDTLKYAEFEYDENRYLKKVWLYIPETQTLGSYKDFFYDNNGQICQIDWFDIEDNIIERNIFSYNNKLIEFNELYRIESGKLKLIYKYRFENDLINHSSTRYTYFWQGNDLVESKYYTKYYYNPDGNINKTHYMGDNYEFIDEYEYDNMNNPFASIEIPISDEVIPLIHFVQYLSNNNVSYHKSTTLDYTNINDTLVSINDGEIFEYKYKDTYLVDKNGNEFYNYIDL